MTLNVFMIHPIRTDYEDLEQTTPYLYSYLSLH